MILRPSPCVPIIVDNFVDKLPASFANPRGSFEALECPIFQRRTKPL
jgi:hypothetical protein